MYDLPPAIGILDITMGKLSKFKPQLSFPGRKAKNSSDGEGSHSEKEKERYTGPYDNAPIPRLTIHSFIMGVFVRVLPSFSHWKFAIGFLRRDLLSISEYGFLLTLRPFRFLWEASFLATIRDKSPDSW